MIGLHVERFQDLGQHGSVLRSDTDLGVELLVPAEALEYWGEVDSFRTRTEHKQESHHRNHSLPQTPLRRARESIKQALQCQTHKLQIRSARLLVRVSAPRANRNSSERETELCPTAWRKERTFVSMASADSEGSTAI